ncbi:MAG: beta galactosidase jelly roll domain-containing protein [Kiritimatiellae bacterium]|nr:beta galactosidase jelly roll domain-containing protein [Kiritimatiellia bacterium]
MKAKNILLFSSILFALAALGDSTPIGKHNFNIDWKYARAKEGYIHPLPKAVAAMEKDGKPFYAPDYDDSDWQTVSVPHPVNAHDEFDEIITGPGEANFYNGHNFYRKHFTLRGVAGRKFIVEFESVRQDIVLWVNGEMVGHYEAGIAPVGFDISAQAKEGENVIAVATSGGAPNLTAKIDTREIKPGKGPLDKKQKGDRPGAGFQWNGTIFNPVQAGLTGNVNLYVKPSCYLTLPLYNNLKTTGAYVWADNFDFEKGTARIHVKAEVRNESGAKKKCLLRFSVCEAGTTGGAPRFSGKSCVIPPANDAGAVFASALEPDVYEKNPAPTRVNTPDVTRVEADIEMKNLVFWSPDTPHLYDVKIELMDTESSPDRVIDSMVVRTGFRKIEYSVENGLTFNGKPFWLRGYAQRSTDEWAAIGVAPDWLQDFDAKLLRGASANFVRWMHVAPKPAPVRAYDKYGVVNVCPAGDAEKESSGRNWRQREEAMRDVMIYFRNSPSVVFYEAGNNQISPEHMKTMRKLREEIDPNGYRFAGCRTLNTPEQIAEAEYVGTMVHRHDVAAYESMKKVGKFMPMVETEYCREESPRRVWDLYTPPDYEYDCLWIGGGAKKPLRDVWNLTQEEFALANCGSADGYTYFYGNRATGNLGKYYSACAMLCWTDCNQHGRNQGTENARMSGRVDPVRIPKENYYVHATIQSDEPRVKILGHWSYPADTQDNYNYKVREFNGDYYAPTGEIARRNPKNKTVYVIGSVHCASVELLVNGKSKGICDKPENVFVFKFPNIDITEQGYIEALARDSENKIIAQERIYTVGKPEKLVMKATTGEDGLRADGSDIAMIDISLVDKEDRVLPYADSKINFTLTGPGIFMGGYNSGTALAASPIGKNWVKLECGVNRVFVKSTRQDGKILLRAESEDGFRAEIELVSKPFAIEGGFAKASQQSAKPNQCDFTPKTNAVAVRDLGALAAGAEPWEVYVEGEKLVFEGAVQPMKPDAMTGVVCEFVPVLDALKAAGAKFDYSYRVKADVPKYLKPCKPPILILKAGGHTLEAICGETQLAIDEDKSARVLTNYEMISVGWRLIGELAPVLAIIPDVEISADDAAKRLDIHLRR